MGVPKITNGIKFSIQFTVNIAQGPEGSVENRGRSPRFSTIPIDLVNVMHKSFVSTPPPPPHLQDSGGIAGLMCGVITFLLSLKCWEIAGGVNIETPSPVRFS